MTRAYDAWGNMTQSQSEGGLAYTGHEWDPETGLYYFQTRYYSASMARFISEDTVGLDGGLNLYAYVANNPINRVDPSGESFVDCARAIAELMAAVGAVEARVADIIAHGRLPDPGHVQALKEAVNRVNNAAARVKQYCACTAAAAAALAAAEKALEIAAEWLLIVAVG